MDNRDADDISLHNNNDDDDVKMPVQEGWMDMMELEKDKNEAEDDGNKICIPHDIEVQEEIIIEYEEDVKSSELTRKTRTRNRKAKQGVKSVEKQNDNDNVNEEEMHSNHENSDVDDNKDETSKRKRIR